MLISGRTRDQESRYQQLKLAAIVRRYDQAIAREITRAMNDMSNKLGKALAEAQVIHKHRENMGVILSKLWADSGKAASNSTFKIAKSFLCMELKKDITTPIVDSAIASWIKDVGRTQILSITGTTLDDTLKIIGDARQDGLSERDTARLVHEAAPFISASRAQTIARTEAHGSSQGISLDVANQTNIPMVKLWISDKSGTARDSHLRIDGQRRALSEDFDVDGEKLRYPGDSSGSAGNVINCKCVIGYDVA